MRNEPLVKGDFWLLLLGLIVLLLALISWQLSLAVLAGGLLVGAAVLAGRYWHSHHTPGHQ